MTSPLRPDDPDRIGDYTLRERLGQGGQGVVYLGESPDGDRAAVKVLSGEWAAADHRVRARLAKEVAATRKVAAFCTAAVLACDLDSDPPYVASEYVAGPTLRQSVKRDGPHRGSALDRLAIASATALVAVHEAGVVHRDFKPANILLGPDGPRVIDFGIARSTDATLTQTGSISGTPAYMAPEQIRGRRVEAATDVFAWAGVMVYAATGASPFGGGSVSEVIHSVLHAPPGLEGVNERLRPLLEVCLDKAPDRRPTALEVLGALIGRDVAAHGGTEATAVLRDGYTAATRAQPRIADTAALAALPGAGAGAAAGGAGATALGGGEAPSDGAGAAGEPSAAPPGRMEAAARSDAGASQGQNRQVRAADATDAAREASGPGDSGTRAAEGARGDRGAARSGAGPAEPGFPDPAAGVRAASGPAEHGQATGGDSTAHRGATDGGGSGGGGGHPIAGTAAGEPGTPHRGTRSADGPPYGGTRRDSSARHGPGRRRAEWSVAAALLLFALVLGGRLAWDTLSGPGPETADPAGEVAPTVSPSGFRVLRYGSRAGVDTRGHRRDRSRHRRAARRNSRLGLRTRADRPSRTHWPPDCRPARHRLPRSRRAGRPGRRRRRIHTVTAAAAADRPTGCHPRRVGPNESAIPLAHEPGTRTGMPYPGEPAPADRRRQAPSDEPGYAVTLKPRDPPTDSSACALITRESGRPADPCHVFRGFSRALVLSKRTTYTGRKDLASDGSAGRGYARSFVLSAHPRHMLPSLRRAGVERPDPVRC
ncbi:serine/threonine-protein kinase [Streptomonospora litoralis]|uniref:Serine/threonine-protein kinase AfsK n=1 Tax=Streptomonospora litoralis TaxID=2498135 RepID=A0A4P6Q6V7_9ACTN|nr:serine/threonine protein kinase [Streptomonospora litoralis]QBI56518.1 Serine/threonine-protein kinase AfsK [Streptomonospora litoralis]